MSGDMFTDEEVAYLRKHFYCDRGLNHGRQCPDYRERVEIKSTGQAEIVEDKPDE